MSSTENLNGEERDEDDVGSDDPLRRAVARVTDEVQQNTRDMGSLAGEVAQLTRRIEGLESGVREARGASFATLEKVGQIGARLERMRGRVERVGPDAEDSAQHKIDDLRAEIERRDNAKRQADLSAKLEEAEATIRRAHERKWQILIEVAKYVIPLLLGAFLSHLAHLPWK